MLTDFAFMFDILCLVEYMPKALGEKSASSLFSKSCRSSLHGSQRGIGAGSRPCTGVLMALDAWPGCPVRPGEGAWALRSWEKDPKGRKPPCPFRGGETQPLSAAGSLTGLHFLLRRLSLCPRGWSLCGAAGELPHSLCSCSDVTPAYRPNGWGCESTMCLPAVTCRVVVGDSLALVLWGETNGRHSARW